MTAHPVPSEPAGDPLVTIAIPTYNRCSWLGDCIRAALAQSYQHFEIVVSDNASTDDTRQVLQQFQDRRLRVLRQATNIGPVPNWNACLAEAKGDYVVFVPDDDRIAPQFLESCVALIRREPELPVVVGLSGVHVVADGRGWQARANKRLATGIWDGVEILEEYLKGTIISLICTTMIRTETLRARGGFPIDWPYAGDLAIWVPYLVTGKAGFVNEYCGYSNSHAATQTSRFAIDIRLRDIQKLVDLISSLAERTLADPKRRGEINVLASRWFGLCAIHLLSLRRKEGVGLMDILPVIVQRHRDLMRIGMANAFRMARPLAVIFLPRPITHCVRYLIEAPVRLQSVVLRTLQR